MTAYPRIALPLFSHGCFVALVLSLGTLKETALRGMPLSPSVISVCRKQNCLDNISWQFEPSSFILEHFFLLGVGLGLAMKWAGITRFLAPQNPKIFVFPIIFVTLLYIVKKSIWKFSSLLFRAYKILIFSHFFMDLAYLR